MILSYLRYRSSKRRQTMPDGWTFKQWRAWERSLPPAFRGMVDPSRHYGQEITYSGPKEERTP